MRFNIYAAKCIVPEGKFYFVLNFEVYLFCILDQTLSSAIYRYGFDKSMMPVKCLPFTEKVIVFMYICI